MAEFLDGVEFGGRAALVGHHRHPFDGGLGRQAGLDPHRLQGPEVGLGHEHQHVGVAGRPPAEVLGRGLEVEHGDGACCPIDGCFTEVRQKGVDGGVGRAQAALVGVFGGTHPQQVDPVGPNHGVAGEDLGHRLGQGRAVEPA